MFFLLLIFMHFLADEMLKGLAKWLRIFGYDVEHEVVYGKKDDEILEYAKSNGLILLTKDRALYRKAKKQGLSVFFIENGAIHEELRQVVRHFGMPSFPEKTRCPKCNSILELIKKEKAEKDKIPLGVYNLHDFFWKCKCGNYYWKGGHWKNIMKMFNKIKKS